MTAKQNTARHTAPATTSGGSKMSMQQDPLTVLRALNQTSAFNQWCGIELVSAGPGTVEITMPWRTEVGQYSGFLHAGVVGALIDTACGYAAATLVGRVLASHYTVNCLRPAVGERFFARARVVKPGKTQTFTSCELFALSDGVEKLVATGETLLCAVGT
jgi:uncharacterized protein (TIGR00369 family)